jgi:hypothetical protein
MRRTATNATIPLVLTLALGAPFLVSAAKALPVLAQTAASASASAASPDDKKKESKEHFDKGVALMQEEAWDAALAEFTVSISLFPTKNGRKNAGACLRALGRFDEALAMYESMIKEHGPALSPAELESANKAIGELKALTGYLQITSNVEGATVVVDGKERGKTPLAGPVVVAAGTRVVRVSKEGYVPFEAKPSVAGKATVVVDAKLEALARSGRLKVVEESGKVMDVVVDGAVVGKTPYEGTVAPGQHAVILKGEGKLGTQPASANVVVDQVFNLRLKAEELAGEAHIETEPPGATLVLDGVPLGQGTWEGALRVGTHKVDANAEGYFGATKSFETPEGKKTLVKVALDRDENSPFWAKGRKRPISIALAVGGLAGLTMGSDYEKSCGGDAQCLDRSRPLGFAGVVRAAYEITPGFAIELDLGYMYATYSLERKLILRADPGSVPNADITDKASVAGPMIGIGASYTFFRQPVVLAGAISGGIILGKVKDTRTGTVDTLAPPTPRTLFTASPTPDSKAIVFAAPEVRVGLPIGDSMQFGLGLGVLIGVTQSVLDVKQSAVLSSSDTTGQVQDPSGKTLGQIKDKGSESVVGLFVLPQASLFFKIAF